MNMTSNNPSIKHVQTILERFERILPKMTDSGARKAAKRETIELIGAAKMADTGGDQSTAVLLLAVASLLKLSAKTKSTESLTELQAWIQQMEYHRAANEADSLPF